MALIKCNECGKEISSKATNCPNCGAPVTIKPQNSVKIEPIKEKKKGSCLKTLLIIIGILIIISLIGSFIGDNDENTSNADAQKSPISNSTEIPNDNENSTSTASEETEPMVETPEEDSTSEKMSEINDDLPTEYTSALSRATSYSEIMHMSKIGIYEQLISDYGDQFTTDAAQYAVDHVTADWKANALAKAKEYSDSMYMSKAGIYDQLTSEYGEKFTKEEAQYAIDHVDADWKANALQKAKDYQELMDMSISAVHDQLTSEHGEKFTKEEADYAIEHLN